MIRVPFWLFFVMMQLSVLCIWGAMCWAGPRIRRWILGKDGE